MSLSLKAELETWAAALKAYDNQDFERALELFSLISDSSKILTNMGIIYATVGEHETAVEHFAAATNLDSYLAIAYFQCGVSNFLLERYDLALLNFEDAYLYLRGNEAINYEQIGLKFKLFSAEIVFNKGLARLNLGYMEGGMADMREASRQKVTDEHGVIDEAIRDHGEGYTVFSIPVGVLYRPPENKLKNSKSKDYLGKAKLVAASDSSDAFTEFTGIKKLQQVSDEDKKIPDPEPFALNRSATTPAPRAGPDITRPTALDRSKTNPTGVGRPDAATILASRRAQSVSNPANVPPPPGPSLQRSNTTLGRSNLAKSTPTSPGMPLGAKSPRGTTSETAGAGMRGLRTGGEFGTVSGSTPATTFRNRPSLPRPQGQGALQQPGVNTFSDVTPPVLPVQPAPEEHLMQFYDSYLDAYSDNPDSQLTDSGPSVSRAQSNASSFYQQPQPRLQEQLPAWMQSGSSSPMTSSNRSTSSGRSRAASRATNTVQNSSSTTGANQGISGPSQNMNMTKGGGTHRRKPSRRPTMRRVTVYDEDEGDDGFVTGEYEIEMANIRVKLHYQGDVRGMTIPPTTSFDEFVERVTTKFGTSLMGLGMKFMDEEGTKISLRDEDDFELAIETARENGKGRSEGKIEIWCVDL